MTAEQIPALIPLCLHLRPHTGSGGVGGGCWWGVASEVIFLRKGEVETVLAMLKRERGGGTTPFGLVFIR